MKLDLPLNQTLIETDFSFQVLKKDKVDWEF